MASAFIPSAGMEPQNLPTVMAGPSTGDRMGSPDHMLMTSNLSWSPDMFDGHQGSWPPGAHGTWPRQDQAPLRDLRPDLSPATSQPPQLSRPISPLAFEMHNDPYTLHESFSSPIITLPPLEMRCPTAAEHGTGRPTSISPPALDPYWQVQLTTERPQEKTTRPWQEGRQYGQGNLGPTQGLARSTSAPVMRRSSGSTGTDQSALDLAAQGFDFSIE